MIASWCVIVQLPWSGILETIVRPEHVFDRLASFLGFDDIDFESVEFSKRFMVKFADRKFAYDLIDARMMECMLSSNSPAWDLEGDSIRLLGRGTFLDSSGFERTLRWLEGFLERWPEYVVRSIEEGKA